MRRDQTCIAQLAIKICGSVGWVAIPHPYVLKKQKTRNKNQRGKTQQVINQIIEKKVAR